MMFASRKIKQLPWLWSLIAALFLWAISIVYTGGAGAGELTRAAFTFASFSVLVGLGQMFVITLGPGNIDLSIPATMTLAATLSLKYMEGHNELVLMGLIIALAIGLAVGILNYALIRLLAIPPIIATLSMSFIVQSLAIWSNRGLRIKPPELLATFVTSTTVGIPGLAVIAVVFSVLCWVVLNKTIYGRWLCAIGQNSFAARMAGVPVDGVRFVTYLACALLAALCGYLLAAFSGGAALNMGAEYLLTSIAVVIIGGSAVSGGNSNVEGIWGASLFLFLIVSFLNSHGADASMRMMLTGVTIITIILVASRRATL